MVRKWAHGGAEPISSFPRSLSQEYKVAFDREGTGPCGPPPQHWSAGLCVWMERGLCGQVRRLRISMVLVLKRTFPPFWKQQLIHRHCPRASGWQACAGGEGGGGGTGVGVGGVAAGWIRSWGVVVTGRMIDQRRGHLIPRCPALGSLASRAQCPQAPPFQPDGVRGAAAGGGRGGGGGQGEVRAIRN